MSEPSEGVKAGGEPSSPKSKKVVRPDSGGARFLPGSFKRAWQGFLVESEYTRRFIWKYRRRIALGLLALVIVDVLEVLPPLILKQAVDGVVASEPVEALIGFAAAYFGISVLQAICRFGWRWYIARSSMFAGRDLRHEYAEKLFGLSSSFYDRKRVGDLISLATNDTEAIRRTLGPGLIVFADSLFYFLSVPVAMLILSPKLTLLAFIPLPFIPFFVIRNEREIHRRFEKVQESFSRIAAMAQENLSGIRLVKAFAREDAQVGRFGGAGLEFLRLNMRLERVQTVFGPTLDFTMSLGLVLLLFVGGQSVIDGSVTLGTFVAFQRYIQKMVWPMAAIGLAVTFYQRGVASSKRLREVMKEVTDVPEPAEPRLPEPSARPGPPGGSWRTPGGIECRNLVFSFFKGPPFLKGVSLRVEPGERVALVGQVGSGKSSLLGLLPRLYPVADGMLFIDGVDVNRWPIDELRRQVGYVSQDVFLFSESVLENIVFGVHWMLADGEREMLAESATQLASVHEDVLGMSEGYRTRLGERGINLSGGQKQRLTIARAIAKRPSILVLDDALSSVDVETEEAILNGLRRREGRNTELIAAHRISTIRDADRIVVLHDGGIVQQGSHGRLLAEKGGLYRRFFEQQRLKEELEHYVREIET